MSNFNHFYNGSDCCESNVACWYRWIDLSFMDGQKSRSGSGANNAPCRASIDRKHHYACTMDNYGNLVRVAAQ
jgi:hypothetical protein